MLSCKPPRVTAEGNSSFDTTSGTNELQAGALKAKPTPIRKTDTKIRYGLSKPSMPSTASMPAVQASQRFIVHKSFFRSTRSASEPAGRVKKKSGSEATVAITEIRNLDGVSMFIIQVAAVSCADTQTPEIKLAIQSLRKTGFLSEVQREVLVIEPTKVA